MTNSKSLRNALKRLGGSVLALILTAGMAVNTATPDLAQAAQQSSISTAPSAETLLSRAVAKAAAENKDVFVVFGASWCPPCRELEAFLNAPRTHDVFARHLVVVHITIWEQDAKLNNPGGEELLHKWGGNGIPLAAFVDRTGQKIAQWDFDSTQKASTRRQLASLLERVAPRVTAAERSAVLMDLRNGLSVVAGRVTDETTQPVAHATVSLVKGTYNSAGQWTPVWGPRTTTDESGKYSFDDVVPGEYRLLANAGARVGVTSTNVPPRSEQTEIDVPVRPLRPSDVSGVLTASDGRPVARAAVILTDLDRPGEKHQTRSGLDGTFVLNGVSSGRYNLWAPIAASPTASVPVEMGTQPVLVVGTDVSGLKLAAKKCATLSGAVSLKGGKIPAAVRTMIRVIADAAELGTGLPRVAAAVRGDGHFQIRGLIGFRVIRLEKLPAAWVLKAIRLNGEDITQKPIDFTGMGSIGGIEVVIKRAGTNSGRF